MNEREITDAVIKVLSNNSQFTVAEIKALYSPPQKDPQLSRFISAAKKARLATALKRDLSSVKSTELTNLLFTTILTLDQLIKKIVSYYNNINA